MNKRQLQKQATRQNIREVAKRLFVSQGFEATTSRQIAREAGIATGTIFVHFPNKQAILVDMLYEDIETAVQQAFSTLSPEKGTVDQLLDIARMLYSYYLQHVELSRVLLQYGLLHDAESSDFRDQIGRFLDEVVRLLEEGQRKQEIVVAKDAQAMAQAFMASYLFVLVTLLGTPSPKLEDALLSLRRLIQVIVT